LYFQRHIKCPPLNSFLYTRIIAFAKLLRTESLPTQRLHSHLVRMRHLSHCDCVSNMIIINKY